MRAKKEKKKKKPYRKPKLTQHGSLEPEIRAFQLLY